jgi:hypothetical protein
MNPSFAFSIGLLVFPTSFLFSGRTEEQIGHKKTKTPLFQAARFPLIPRQRARMIENDLRSGTTVPEQLKRAGTIKYIGEKLLFIRH